MIYLNNKMKPKGKIIFSGGGQMSTQAVIDQINNLTDDGVELIDNIINSLNPKYFVVQPDEKKRDVSRRIGAGKGVIGNTDHFDDDNEEISALFTNLGSGTVNSILENGDEAIPERTRSAGGCGTHG